MKEEQLMRGLLNTDRLRFYCEMLTARLLKHQKRRFIDRGGNILAVAHCDHVDIPYRFDVSSDGEKIICPRLDDRLGVYLAMEVLPQIGVECDLLLTDGEELGRSTARNFIPEKNYNWIIELDRAGSDAVVYQYREMESPVFDCFPYGEGSFSDISHMEQLGVGAFNAGIGYHFQHTRNCYCRWDEVAECLCQIQAFYQKNKDRFFEHCSSC